MLKATDADYMIAHFQDPVCDHWDQERKKNDVRGVSFG